MAKIILKFLAIFIFVYLLLIIPQTNAGDKYSVFLRCQAQFFLGTIGDNGVAEFLPNTEAHKWNFPTIVNIYNSGHYEHSLKTGATYQWTRISLDMYHDFLFVTFLTALILATPFPLRRKIPAFLLAMILIHLYVDISIYIELVNTFKNTPVLEAAPLSPLAERLVNFLHPILRVNYGTGFFAALFIWVLTCFRSDDLIKLKQLATAKES